MRKFLGFLALVLLVGACNNVFGNSSDDESATTAARSSSATATATVTGNPGAEYTASRSLAPARAAADGRRYRRCSNDASVYDGGGVCHVGGETVTVARVVDGDTVELGDGRRVRILGVDAPETGSCGANEATDFTRIALIGNPLVVLHREPGVTQDQYGRELGYLQYVDVASDTDKHWASPASEDLGANLTLEGWADAYESGGANATYMQTIRNAVDIAKQVYQGRWGPPCGARAPVPAPADDGSGSVYVDTDDDDHNMRDGALTGGFCARKWYC